MRKISSFLAVTFLLCGCSATIESRLDSVRNNYMAETTDTEFENKNNLDLLLTADALFHANDIANADKAYETFNKRNINSTGGDILREATTLTFGANANDYKPYMMDSLFVSYYQLWAAIADGRFHLPHTAHKLVYLQKLYLPMSFYPSALTQLNQVPSPLTDSPPQAS